MRIPSIPSLSIRARTIFLMLAVMLPAVAGVVWFVHAESRDAMEAANLRVKDLADETASHVDLVLRDYKAHLTQLATRADIKSLDHSRCQPLLSEYLQLHSEFNTLAVHDSNANLVCSAHLNPLPATDSRKSIWFNRGLQEGEFTVGQAEVGHNTRRWVSVLTRQIVDDSGQITGLLSLPLDLLKLNAQILSDRTSGVLANVIDQNGNILLRSIDPEKWIGHQAPVASTLAYSERGTSFALRKGVDGVSRLYAFVSIPSTGWRVVVGVPEEEVFAKHRQRLGRSIALSVGVMLLSLWLAFRFSAAIVKPISELADTAARIAAGDTAARALIGGPKEIGAVANAFNRMLDARVVADAALRRLSEAVEQSPVSIVMTDTAGNIQYVNHKFTYVTGYTAEEVLGHNSSILKSGELADEAYRQLWKTITAGHEWSGEFHNRKKSGELFWEYARILPIRDAAGNIANFLAVKEDITERKRSIDELRVLSRAVEQSPASILITDREGRIEYVNPRFEEITGYAKSEVLGRNPQMLKSGLTPAETYSDLWNAISEGGEWRGELCNRAKNGELFWEYASISGLRDETGEVIRYIAVKEDITERKHAEESVHTAHKQLRQLTMQLNDIHEAESNRLSRELHDELGQMLSSLKMDLGWLASELGETNPELKKKVSASIVLVEESVRSVRSIAARLRPRILDELGLVPAIEWLARDFRERTGIDVALVSNTQASELTPERATAVFRIVQESLTNIARHANARCVDVSLDADGGRLTVEVRDDGKGVRFLTKTDYESVGLLGMRERALAAGGELELESFPGKGTVVSLRLPLKMENP